MGGRLALGYQAMYIHLCNPHLPVFRLGFPYMYDINKPPQIPVPDCDTTIASHRDKTLITTNPPTISKMPTIRFINAPFTHRLLHCSSRSFQPPAAALACGNGMSGTGLPRNLHSGSHPSEMSHSRSRSGGTRPWIMA